MIRVFTSHRSVSLITIYNSRLTEKMYYLRTVWPSTNEVALRLKKIGVPWSILSSWQTKAVRS